MRKLIQKLKNNTVFGIIVGALIFGSLGIYAAGMYMADDITYTKDGLQTNVKESLDDLYNKVTEIESFTTKTLTQSFTAPYSYATLTFNFDFPHQVLGITQITGTNANGDTASVGIWNNMISISGNKLDISIRGVPNGTSGTVTVTAIGY